jgi:type IV pilus assembly protein PilB
VEPTRKIFGRLLVEDAGVPAAVVERALAEQRESGQRLGEVLVRHSWADEETVARTLAQQLGLAHDPPPIDPHPQALELVSERTARERSLLPLRSPARALRLAMVDPLDLAAVDDVQFRTGRRVEPVVVSRASLRHGLDRVYGAGLGSLIRTLPGVERPDRQSEGDLEEAARAAPVVRLVDHVLHQAVARRASDVHIEHRGQRVVIRLRVDGLLRPLAEMPARTHAAMVSRIKIMAGLDIAVKRRPQDGGLSFSSGRARLTLRVSTLPVDDGEKVVVRLLDPASAPDGLGDLGLSTSDLARLRGLLARGEGVVLTAGPTGSGKSTTLFGALGEVDRETLNVVTLEDPIEYRRPGINQVQVRPRAGLTFPAALRSILRQDPDVVMVGEIRDPETAEIAMAAAVTGHLVLSTIHTIDAAGAITRLLHMGVPPFLVSGGLAGVVGQRLVRRRCPQCQGHEVDGCSACADGYVGRTGVFQVLVVTDAIREEVVGEASATTLRRLAHEAGMGSLADDARRKVAEGITTPHEIGRVLQGEPGSGAVCPRCRADVPSGALGCPTCGNALRRMCACGSLVRPGWRFCAWCLRPVPG